jgi:hypothetical protein
LNLVFFTDRDLGKRFPEILASAGLNVERHHDFFPPRALDEQWLQYVDENGRIAVTHDTRIRYKPNELAAVVRYRVVLLVVIGKLPYPKLAENFVNTVPRIAAFLTQHEAPFIAKIYRPSPAEVARNAKAPGTISLWYSKERL